MTFIFNDCSLKLD